MKTTVEIQNLKCGGCVNTIINRLENLTNISDVLVDNDTDSVSFDFNDQPDLDEAVALLAKLGYPVSGTPNSLSKQAKSFVSCAIGRMNN